MARRPCLDCGTLSEHSRCETHRLAEQRIRYGRHEARRERASRDARGYGYAWRKYSLEQRQAQPWCSRCGTDRDLTVDHVVPGTLEYGTRVLCRSCHGRIGARTDRVAGGG